MAVLGCPAATAPRPPRTPTGRPRAVLSPVATDSPNAPALGLTSRRNFERVVSNAMLRQEKLLIAILDVDHFRVFKNLYGMSAGEALLRALSRRLDAAASLVAGSLVRLGADEFAIVIPCREGERDSGAWAQAQLAEASAPFAHRGTVLTFSATLGFALLPDHGETVEEALHCARLAVVQGKQAGGSVAVPCSTVLLKAARGRDELARELRGAIASGQIIPFYQPVVALGTGCISGLEVLARWIHPVHGLLSPAVFIPLAEEQGLTLEISRALLIRLQRESRTWPRHWHFAINTTPRDVVMVLAFIEGPEFFGHDMLDPARIELEVTESAVMRDLTESPELLAAFMPRGAKLVIDDFGTGYANFQQLRRIPFARLKIDKSFIVDMLKDPRAAGCVQAIIQLAHHLGMTATAEGVEFAALADRLIEMECDHAQGFHYARPMPADEVAWLIDQPGFGKGGLDHAA